MAKLPPKQKPENTFIAAVWQRTKNYKVADKILAMIFTEPLATFVFRMITITLLISLVTLWRC